MFCVSFEIKTQSTIFFSLAHFAIISKSEILYVAHELQKFPLAHELEMKCVNIGCKYRMRFIRDIQLFLYYFLTIVFEDVRIYGAEAVGHVWVLCHILSIFKIGAIFPWRKQPHRNCVKPSCTIMNGERERRESRNKKKLKINKRHTWHKTKAQQSVWNENKAQQWHFFAVKNRNSCKLTQRDGTHQFC